MKLDNYEATVVERASYLRTYAVEEEPVLDYDLNDIDSGRKVPTKTWKSVL